MTQQGERVADEADDSAGDALAFGAYLRSQRQLARLSLRQLAERTSVSNPYLSQIERGLHRPSIAVVKSLARALNLAPDTLLAQAAGVDEETAPVPTVSTEAAIQADARLSPLQRQTLLAVYRTFVEGDALAAAVDSRQRSTAAKGTPASGSPADLD